MTTIERPHTRVSGVSAPAVSVESSPPHANTTRPRLATFGPNWFATVMGTGIVAVAAAGLPVTVPGLLPAARAVWVLAAVLLVIVTGATALHWLRHRDAARRHIDDPVLAHFYGAPAMALLTVGAGAYLLASPLFGESAALWTAGCLWALGTTLGLATAVAVPLRAFTRHRISPDGAGGPWLMSVVPPMVSAATGAALVGHVPAGQWQLTLMLACYAMFGLTAAAALIITTLVWSRLMHHSLGAAAMVPTLWIALGPVGQSITAADHLGGIAEAVLPGPVGRGLEIFGVVYGLPILGFGLLWVALAVGLTLHVRRTGLPFALTWWSFTFPVGTMVTGCSALAASTGAVALAVLAVMFFVGLVGAWITVAWRTIAGLRTGELLGTPIAVRSR